MDIEVLYGAKFSGEDVEGDVLTLFDHTMTTGQKVWIASDGYLPSPLESRTDYYVIADDSSHVRLADSPEDAAAGVAVTLSDGGSREHTVLYRHRVPVGLVADIPKDRVLMIILSAPHPTAPRSQGNSRVAQATGKDFYCLVHKYRDADHWFMLDGWDATELTTFHRVDHPFAVTSTEVAGSPPFQGLASVFTGYSISAQAWADAETLADSEVH